MRRHCGLFWFEWIRLSVQRTYFLADQTLLCAFFLKKKRSPLCHPHRRTFARCPFSPAVEPHPDDLLAVFLLVCVVRTLLLPFSPLARPFNAQEMEVQELSIRKRIT